MPTFESSIDVRATAEALFRMTQDYTHRLDWDPFLREARLLSASEPGVGVRAFCVARTGLGMETEYVSFSPPRAAAVKMTRGPALLGSFSGSWRFVELGPGLTRVIFRYHLEARPRWLRALLDPLLMMVFRRDTRQRLDALKRAAEEPGPPPAAAQETRGT